MNCWEFSMTLSHAYCLSTFYCLSRGGKCENLWESARTWCWRRLWEGPGRSREEFLLSTFKLKLKGGKSISEKGEISDSPIRRHARHRTSCSIEWRFRIFCSQPPIVIVVAIAVLLLLLSLYCFVAIAIVIATVLLFIVVAIVHCYCHCYWFIVYCYCYCSLLLLLVWVLVEIKSGIVDGHCRWYCRYCMPRWWMVRDY